MYSLYMLLYIRFHPSYSQHLNLMSIEHTSFLIWPILELRNAFNFNSRKKGKQHYDFHDAVIHISFNVMPGKNFLFKYQNFTEKKK